MIFNSSGSTCCKMKCMVCQSVYYVIYRVVDMFRPRQEVHRDPQDLGPLPLADSHHRLFG